MRKEDIEKLWNDQADEYNQWSELDSDEKVEWTIQCFEKDIVAEFEGKPSYSSYHGKNCIVSNYFVAMEVLNGEFDEDRKYKIIIKEVE